MKTGEQATYRLLLRPIGAGPPGPIRLRRFLKMALRGYGLRCVDLAEVPGPTPAAEEPPAGSHQTAQDRSRIVKDL